MFLRDAAFSLTNTQNALSNTASVVVLQVAQMLAPALGISGLAAGLSVLVAGLIVFGPTADWLGGPGTLFNPSHNLAFAALGDGKKRVHLMRMVNSICQQHNNSSIMT